MIGITFAQGRYRRVPGGGSVRDKRHAGSCRRERFDADRRDSADLRRRLQHHFRAQERGLQERRRRRGVSSDRKGLQHDHDSAERHCPDPHEHVRGSLRQNRQSDRAPDGISASTARPRHEPHRAVRSAQGRGFAGNARRSGGALLLRHTARMPQHQRRRKHL